MKRSYILSMALASVLLASCNKDHKKEHASDRSDTSSYVPVDSSTDGSNHGGVPTYDERAGKRTTTSDSDNESNTSDPGSGSGKARVDHSTREFNGRYKNDSSVMNSGVAGQQGAGSGVGNGGSINGADDTKHIK